MRYAAWLHVFGKMRTHLPSRTAALVDSYVVRLSSCLEITHLLTHVRQY